MNTAQNSCQLAKSVNVLQLEAVHLIGKTWKETLASTIQSCFRKTGFARHAEALRHAKCYTHSDADDSYDNTPIQQLIDTFPNFDYKTVSSVELSLATEEAYSEPKWEETFLNTVCFETSNPDCASDTDDDDIVVEPSSSMTK